MHHTETLTHPVLVGGVYSTYYVLVGEGGHSTYGSLTRVRCVVVP